MYPNPDQQQTGRVQLVFSKGPLQGRKFLLTQPSTTLGRYGTNDIVIPDPKISRYHARIVCDQGIWRIENLSRPGATIVDRREVEKVVLTDNSIIELGEDTACVFSLSASSVVEVPTFYMKGMPAGEAPVGERTIPYVEVPKIGERDLPYIESVTRDEAQESPQGKRAAKKGEQTVPGIVGEATAPQMPDVEQPPITPVEVSHTQIASYTSLGIPSLEIMNNTTGASSKYPLLKQVVNLGRDSSNDIVVNDGMVSDFHLQIVRQNGQWILHHPHPAHQQTNNGLLYQGRKIRGNRTFSKQLARGDVFRIEDAQGSLLTITYNDGSNAPQVVLPALQPIPLLTPTITIGRLPENDVILNHPQVSARHATLTAENGAHRLTDLNSTNRTYVNGLAITNVLLKPDDEIRIGPFRLVYTGSELRQYNESESIGIDVVNLRKVGNNQTVLLNDISLSIPPRSFVALVGSSGAGKSTLMDALSGLRPAQQGTVLYNGQDYYRNLASFRLQLGYVPQEDIIHRDLTVERALHYAARLRLPGDFTPEQIEQRIDEVLEDVEMTHRRSLLIKKLSGGQRKRISIALELLAKPSIFFLDEPTSGLDPGLDRKMMLLLRKLADKGHTVILVTHATSNINICDTVCFMAQGGRLAYYGPPEAAKAYFGQPDFAEIYNVLEPTDEHPTIPQEAEERFKTSQLYQQYIAVPLKQKEVQQTQPPVHKQSQMRPSRRHNPFNQFIVLCQRYLELLWNDKWNLSILFLQAPVIGFILFILVRTLNEATVFHQPIPLNYQGDAQRFLFILSFAALMFGCINAAREIIKEMPIYKRERTVNLGITSYLFSKIIILGALCLVQCAILLAIMALAAHFYQGIVMLEIWETYIATALVSISGVMIGLAISALVRNSDQAMSFIPLLLIPQVIFSGSMFPLKNIPLQVFGAFFSLRWAMAALGSSMNLMGNGDKVFGTCDSCNTYQHDPHYLIYTWLAIVATILILSFLTGYALKRKDNND